MKTRCGNLLEEHLMLEELLRVHADRMPKAIAIRAYPNDGGREWTNEQIWTLSCKAAARLRSSGVNPGDRVVLYAENSPEWILAYLGIYLAGAVAVPLDVQYTSREIGTVCKFADCRVILCSQAKRQIAESILPDVLAIEQGSDLYEAPVPEHIAPRKPEELMTVIFTSGTTGEPKGASLTVGNIMSNVESLLKMDYIRKGDVFLCLLPLHHCYALTTSVLVPLAAGCPITLCTSLQGPDILTAMRETRVSIVMGVPKLYEGLDRAIFDKVNRASYLMRRVFSGLMRLSHGLRRVTGWNAGRVLFPGVHRAFGRSFRFFVSGGAKLDRVITERFLDLGIKVIEGYGLTETAPVVTLNPIRRIRPGSVGTALPGVEVKIEQAGADGVGEIAVRGPNVMQGYDRRPDETAGVLRDGWFYTGDLGFLDSDRYLHITGRLKEVIVLPSGKNIYPEDVERYYERSGLIKDICVLPVGQSDGRVERLRALVVPAFDELRRIRATSTYDTIHQEITRLSQGLPSYMRVTDLKIVTDELPRTRLGKLRRAEIQHMALNEVVQATAQVSPRDQALLAVAGADWLIARLRSLSGHTGEIVPASNLELDLGIDSLGRVELEVILDKEFGVKIPAEEAADLVTVGDILKRLSPEHREKWGQEGWNEILAKPVSPPLSELFDLHPGLLKGGSLRLLRHAASRLSRWMFPLDVQGLENLPTDRPFLLCPSHSSLIDSVLIYMSLPDRFVDKVFYLGAAEFFESAFMRWIGRNGRVIPTATTDTVLTSLRRVAEVLRMGMSVCIFPEGHITRDGFLQRPRPGAGILACELNVPIVPVLIRGTYEILSYTHPGFRFRPIGLTIARPIEPPPKGDKVRFDNSDYAAVMADWEQVLRRLRLEDDASGSRTAGRSPRIKESPAGA
jgi:long-chain acyl-CoA synthetase